MGKWFPISEQMAFFGGIRTYGVTGSGSLGLPSQVSPAILLASSSSRRQAVSPSSAHHRRATPAWMEEADIPYRAKSHGQDQWSLHLPPEYD